LVLTKDLNSIFTTFRILKGIRLDKTVYYIPINVTFSPHHFQNTQKYENEEIVFVATLKLPVATCGEWRQGWTTLFYNIVVAHQKSLKLATEN